MRKNRIKKNITMSVALVSLLVFLLAGCKTKSVDKTTEIIKNNTHIITSTETPVPTEQITTATATLTVDNTPAIIETASVSTATPEATIQQTTQVIKTKTPTNKTTVAPTATPTKEPSASKLLTAYKDVAMIGGYMMSIMSPFSFSNAWDASKNAVLGSYDKQNFFGFERVMYRPFLTGKAKTEGARYFELPMTGQELFDDEKYIAYQRQGAFPFMACIWGNQSKDLNVSNFPAGINKVYFDNWALDKYDDIRNAEGPSTNWTNTVVIPDLEDAIAKVKTKCPNATIYIGGVLPWVEEFPRIAPEYPDSFWTQPVQPGDLYHVMATKDTPAKFKECNNALKKFANDNGYKFVDFLNTELVDAQGYRKSEYAHYMDVGEFPSRSCMRIYGDTIMKAMGLPVAPKLT